MTACRERGFTVEHGEFGADMAVTSCNDGPVTILYDTEKCFSAKLFGETNAPDIYEEMMRGMDALLEKYPGLQVTLTHGTEGSLYADGHCGTQGKDGAYENGFAIYFENETLTESAK